VPKWRRIGFRDLVKIRDERLARRATVEGAAPQASSETIR
jgi:hypothetical protein